MLKRYRELLYALGLIVVATVVYEVGIKLMGIRPAPRGVFGHTFGVVGFILMLMTETLYSLRKRVAGARWGATAKWLRFHMVTGLVGPYMVLLHPAMAFQGLAGALSVLTLIVVMSGLTGRYIYSAIPRTIEGAELQAAQIERAILDADVALERSAPGASGLQSVAVSTDSGGLGAVDGRRQPAVLRGQAGAGGLSAASRQELHEVQALARRRQLLQRQLEGLAAARRALSVWRSLHVPMALVLFVMAFVHVVGALYYSTLLH